MKIRTLKQLQKNMDHLKTKRQSESEKLELEFKLLRYELPQELVKSIGKIF